MDLADRWLAATRAAHGALAVDAWFCSRRQTISRSDKLPYEERCLVKKLIVVPWVVVCVSTSSLAQARGGRQGGAGFVPQGPQCYTPGTAAVKTTDRVVDI